MATDFHIVSTAADLRALCARLAHAPEVAIDTEFHGEHTYWPRLMLLQIATRDELALVDPLAPELGRRELARLLGTIRSSGALVVGHALSGDLSILERIAGAPPARVFDTQVAAAFLGAGQQPGLARLLSAWLDVELPKGHTMADWSRRPLPAEQLEYAAADVRHLLPMADRLRAELAARGRLGWAEEECERLLDPAFYAPPDPADAWRRVKGRMRMGAAEAPVLRELAAERERIAIERDLPRKAVLGDELLVDLARRGPTHVGALERDSRRGGSRGLRQYGPRWVAAVRRAASARPETPPPPAPPLTAGQDELVTLARLLVTTRARQAEVAPALLNSRVERALPSLLREPPADRAEFDARLGLSGWRAQLVGDGLWGLLAGHLRATAVPTAEGLELAWLAERPEPAAAALAERLSGELARVAPRLAAHLPTELVSRATRTLARGGALLRRLRR